MINRNFIDLIVVDLFRNAGRESGFLWRLRDRNRRFDNLRRFGSRISASILFFVFDL